MINYIRSERPKILRNVVELKILAVLKELK